MPFCRQKNYSLNIYPYLNPSPTLLLCKYKRTSYRFQVCSNWREWTITCHSPWICYSSDFIHCWNAYSPILSIFSTEELVLILTHPCWGFLHSPWFVSMPIFTTLSSFFAMAAYNSLHSWTALLTISHTSLSTLLKCYAFFAFHIYQKM